MISKTVLSRGLGGGPWGGGGLNFCLFPVLELWRWMGCRRRIAFGLSFDVEKE
eukprot:TRINITY_DN9871_c0_g1_i1.p1 TRINITY_DN9871_c0_g1~~TRINITY_DN9871_c0_g1_i1.p1  ORF type:complete len:53 (-),score=7.95 TRINITY_DN9871_c0_g1_i1:223-381(-)